MLLELAILKNFDSGTYKAGVQLAGSLTTYFDDVPVSRAIPTSALVTGNRVILAIPGDNPKDAVVIATWPQGSPGGGMEVHGNEYHDPDFATVPDIAVDTNLSAAAQDAIAKKHTQGTDTALGAVGTKNPPIDADKVIYRNSASGDSLVTLTWSQLKAFLKTYNDTLYPPLAHKAQHEWGGSDELSLAQKFANMRMAALINFDTHDAWTEANSGSALITWQFRNSYFYTGATISSICSAYMMNTGDMFMYETSVGFYLYTMQYALTASTIWIVAMNAITPSDTTEHIGFKIINGEIYASCANGVTQTITDTGVSIQPAWTAVTLSYRRLSWGVLQFYVNGVLKATHTTNIPNSGRPSRLMIYITNSAATDQRLAVISIYAADDSL